MKAKLIINGQEIEVDLDDAFLEKNDVSKKTGYERVDRGQNYFYTLGEKIINFRQENRVFIDNAHFETANYYSSREVAANNVRADTLMRKLRRFAVEHREKHPNWNCPTTPKWTISFNHDGFGLCVTSVFPQHFGGVYFGTVDEAKAAIEAFEVDLLWYFTEYKDSL